VAREPSTTALIRQNGPPVTAVSLTVPAAPLAARGFAAAPEIVASAPPVTTPSPKDLPPAARTVEDAPALPLLSGRIDGRIFLSAQSGLNYTPGNVDVRLYPLSALQPYLEKRGFEANARFEELKGQIQAAEAEKERKRAAANAAFAAYSRADANSPERPSLERANVDARKARETATNYYYALLREREDSLSGAFYVDALPEPADVTQTDSQGHFAFRLPERGEYAVVAGVQRNDDEAVERYYWFVPVKLSDEAQKTVLLSNQNVTSQPGAESLVRTVE
jgi:hypothetical protein